MSSTGIIKMLTTNSLPDGWLMCDGSAIPAEHLALIALVGPNTPLIGAGRFIKSGLNPLNQSSASATVNGTVNLQVTAELQDADANISFSVSESAGNHSHKNNTCNNENGSYSGWNWHINGEGYGHKGDGSKNNPFGSTQSGLNDHSHGMASASNQCQSDGDHSHTCSAQMSGSHKHTFRASGTVDVNGPDSETRAPSLALSFMIKT